MPTERYALDVESRPPANKITSILLTAEQAEALKREARRGRVSVSAYCRNLLIEHLTALGLYDEDGEQRRHLASLSDSELGVAEQAPTKKSGIVTADLSGLSDEELYQREQEWLASIRVANSAPEQGQG